MRGFSKPNILPSLWRGERSYFETSGPDQHVEVDCYRCGSCGGIRFCCDRITKAPVHIDEVSVMNPRCGRICLECAKLPDPQPFDERLARMERRAMEIAKRDPAVVEAKRALDEAVDIERRINENLQRSRD